MRFIKKAALAATASSVIVAGVIAGTTVDANASNPRGCVTLREASRVHSGDSPGTVGWKTHASPWYSTTEYEGGNPYRVSVYYDCRTGNGLDYVVVYAMTRALGSKGATIHKFMRGF